MNEEWEIALMGEEYRGNTIMRRLRVRLRGHAGEVGGKTE
jgi:hypothetical protein